LETFDTKIAGERKKVSQLCSDKEYHYNDMIAYKIAAFADRESNIGMGKYAVTDMDAVKKTAKRMHHWISIDRLGSQAWLVSILQQLKDIVKRATMLGDEISASAIRLLAVMQLFAMQDVHLTVARFFAVIERVFVRQSDHSKQFVHRIVRAVRESESVGIDAASFLAYLEARDIQPCAELLGQVRDMKRKLENRKTTTKKRSNTLLRTGQGQGQVEGGGDFPTKPRDRLFSVGEGEEGEHHPSSSFNSVTVTSGAHVTVSELQLSPLLEKVPRSPIRH
jgi:hypothetical protein